MTVLSLTDPGRISRNGPGIVAFELAGHEANAAAIVAAWGELGTKVAAFNLGFDYLFILGYSTFMTLLCLWARGRYSNPTIAFLGVVLAWLQWLAGFLDCAENAALLAILFSGVTEARVELARACAAGKFALLACGALYVVVSIPSVGKVREVS